MHARIFKILYLNTVQRLRHSSISCTYAKSKLSFDLLCALITDLLITDLLITNLLITNLLITDLLITDLLITDLLTERSLAKYVSIKAAKLLSDRCKDKWNHWYIGACKFEGSRKYSSIMSTTL